MSKNNYYESLEYAFREGPSERYPKNHVKYSRLLKPLELLNRVYLRFGGGPLAIQKALLREFDAAAPYDACLGTAEERNHLRASVAALANGLDENPYLSGVGRMLIKNMSMGHLKARRNILEHYHNTSQFYRSPRLRQIAHYHNWSAANR